MAPERLELPGGFDLLLPPGWSWEADEEEGGILVAAEDGPGLLHLISFPGGEGEPADPAEELYAFLEDQGVELEEDEVDDLELPPPAEIAFCEYLTEDDLEGDARSPVEADEATTYWLVAVATAPGSLLFANYSSPAPPDEPEREAVLGILRSLTFTGAA